MRLTIRRYRVRAPDESLFARKTPSFWMALGRGLRKLPTTFATADLKLPKTAGGREGDGTSEKDGIFYDPRLKGRPRSRRETIVTMAQWYDARFLIRRYRVRPPDGALFARKTPSFGMALGKGVSKLPIALAAVANGGRRSPKMGNALANVGTMRKPVSGTMKGIDRCARARGCEIRCPVL